TPCPSTRHGSSATSTRAGRKGARRTRLPATRATLIGSKTRRWGGETMTLYLNRKEQSEYLKERGIRYSPNTLQKLATIGGGPRYVIIGNRAMSTIEWLEDW